MKPLRHAGRARLQLVVVIAATLLSRFSATFGEEKNKSTWSLYIEVMCSQCVTTEKTTMSKTLTHLRHCVRAQQEYLRCVSSSRLLSKLDGLTITSSRLQAPCGLLHLSRNNAASIVTRQWTITVHSQLYLNFTFEELVLPMPYNRCDRYQVSEVLVISNNALALRSQNSVFLCGEHSPFSMLWTNNHALLVYQRVTFSQPIGHFTILYQVSDQRARKLQRWTISHSSGFQPMQEFLLQLRELLLFQRGHNQLEYSVHLLGSRLTLLDVMFVFQGTGKKHFNLKVFDGPVPAVLHQNLIEQEAFDTRWIHLSTFQAYLQISCESHHCSDILIKYKWPSALPLGYEVSLSSTLKIAMEDFTQLCSERNRFYCLFKISTDTGTNVEIFLQEVHFYGPDYPGEFNEPFNCLLAGVTIADGYRAELMNEDNYFFKNLERIPKDLAVDSLFPEITTCSHVPLAFGGKVVPGFPIDTFVSYGQTLVLVIYAYGGHVDLSKSHVQVAIRPSYSAGLIVSCPKIPGNGYIIESSDATFVPEKAFRSDARQLGCPNGNLFYVFLDKTPNNKYDTVPVEVFMCFDPQARTTKEVYVLPFLSSLVGSAVRARSFYIQMNPYARETEIDCSLKVTDGGKAKYLDYNLSAKVPVILGRALYGVATTSITSGTHFLGAKERFSGRYAMLHTYMASTYTNTMVNVSVKCTAPFRIQSKEKHSLEHYLNQSKDTVPCQSYRIPSWSNQNKTNDTYLMYLSKPVYLEMLSTIMEQNSRIGKLTAHHLNLRTGEFLLIVKVKWHEECDQRCKYTKIQLAYKTLVSHSMVLLEWNTSLSSDPFQAFLYDMPVSEPLLFHTSENSDGTKDVCLANLEVHYGNKEGFAHGIKEGYALPRWSGNTSAETPFAEYHLLWTHREYTWNEAEDMCQQFLDGHLASTSSEQEYLLISRMLLGTAFYAEDTGESLSPILTPCLMDSPLCVIYIGLKRKKATFSWSDGRPTGYLRWNKNYIRGLGPVDVRYYSQYRDRDDTTLKHLLKAVRTILQPQYTNKTLCSVLMGSPGPQDMEFVSVPCRRKLPVSGIMCIKGGNKPSKERPLYRLTHWKVKAKDSQIMRRGVNSYFNIDTLYEAVIKGKNPPKGHGGLGAPAYYEYYRQIMYSMASRLESQKKIQAWTENIYNCSNSTDSQILCDLLWPYNETSTNRMQTLSADMFISNSNQGIHNFPLSTVMSNGSLIAPHYCGRQAIFDGRQCLLLVQTPAAGNTSKLDSLCKTVSKESLAYVHFPQSDVAVLISILQKLNIAQGQALCYNQTGQTGFTFLKDGKLDINLSQSVDPGSQYYVICSIPPTRLTCPSGYTICNNECISEQILCDGTVDCENGKDEHNCSYLCDSFDKSPHFCLTRCHPDNCTCHDLYFQCSSGGCLHSSKVCDGHADCIHSEDENVCYSLTYALPTTNTKNDFIPDTKDYSDEKIYMNLLISRRNVAEETCSSLHWVPCLKHHPACYPIDKMCLYEHTEDGRLKHCGNGLHLLGCEDFQCSGSFKCQHSYCVPTYKVCNGVQDCPYGDDESTCPISACINMLRCGHTCVHPREICDGTTHCEFGEDELTCGVPKCPQVCHCSGYAIKCYSFIVPDASFQRIIMFSLRLSNFLVSNNLFKHLKSLVILDLSYCSINLVSSKAPFLELYGLVTLDLSHNQIPFLTKSSLKGVINLKKLDLSWNPLSYLETSVFAQMKRLQILSLQQCRLKVVPDLSSLPTNSLNLLDVSLGGVIELECMSLSVAVFNLTQTVVNSIKHYSTRCLHNVNHVISDQKGFCCLQIFKEKCEQGWAVKHKLCASLLLSQIILIFILLLIIATCNICVLIYKLITQSSDGLLICNLALTNTFMVVPLYILIKWYLLHGAEFAFFEPFLSKTVTCRIAGDMCILSTQLSAFFQMLTSLQKYCGIVHRQNILLKHKRWFYVVLGVTWTSLVFGCTFHHFQDKLEKQTNSLSRGMFYNYYYRYPILPTFALLDVGLAIATIFFYSRILLDMFQTKRVQIGRKHGRDATSSGVLRVAFIITLTSVSTFAMLSFTASCYLSSEVLQTVVSFIIVFSVPSALNPFLFTLSTKNFVQDGRKSFLLVLKAIESVVRRR